MSRREGNGSALRALVFWLSLSIFVFSFTAGDELHSRSCQQEGVLKWASRGGQGVVKAISPHSIGVDSDCAICAIHGLAFTVAIVPVTTILLLSFALFWKDLSIQKRSFILWLPSARGPPAMG